MHSSRIPSVAVSAVLLLGARAVAADCPAVWSNVASNLASQFAGCTDLARQAIRASFHDCFPGACDGSLILSDECTTRPENQQMKPVCSVLNGISSQDDVSAADLIQLGTAVGIASCNGQFIQFLVGRTDDASPNPENQLPPPTSSAEVQIAAFTAKGFTTSDLVALVGAHTIGKNLSGTALDTTDSKWDNTFYRSTLDHSAPASLETDVNLSVSDLSSGAWRGFAASESDWESAFAAAFAKMSVMGNDVSALTDCSSVVTDAIANASSGGHGQTGGDQTTGTQTTSAQPAGTQPAGGQHVGASKSCKARRIKK